MDVCLDGAGMLGRREQAQLRKIAEFRKSHVFGIILLPIRALFVTRSAQDVHGLQLLAKVSHAGWLPQHGWLRTPCTCVSLTFASPVATTVISGCLWGIIHVNHHAGD